MGRGPHDRYALAVTYNRLLIRYQLKVMRTVADHSMGAEMHPTTEAGMQAEYISEVARALRRPLDAPVVIASDSLSNARVARRQGTTVKVRHQLRRWQALTARIVRGLVKVLHVPDLQMPVDFLTTVSGSPVRRWTLLSRTSRMRSTACRTRRSPHEWSLLSAVFHHFPSVGRGRVRGHEARADKDPNS